MFEHPYTLGVRVAAPVSSTRVVVETALRAEGFGILTEIDMSATLRAKLGVEMAPYLILGACNPPLAHRAVMAEPSIGALLPCNVVIREDGGGTVVEAMDPGAALGLVHGAAAEEVAGVAADARARLVRALQAIADASGGETVTA